MKKLLELEEIKELFTEVQKSSIFSDQKQMADAIPKLAVEEILEKYNQEKNKVDFDLKNFVTTHFSFPESLKYDSSEHSKDIQEHIKKLWKHLSVSNPENQGTLIGLPKPYVVPGGRFNEFFYWDSYFAMLGLQVHNEVELMENIVENCAFLINNYGKIPNGNRTYFLSRSQPPYFFIMLELLAETLQNDNLIVQYLPILEKEYQYWMDPDEQKIIEFPDNVFINRYFDKKNEPREESYSIDIEDQGKSKNPKFYQDIRSACESGWDFSSRWFEDPKDFSTIETSHIIPVELNSLLLKLEQFLGKSFKTYFNNLEKSEFYLNAAKKRSTAIDKYLWNDDEKRYADYNFIEGKNTKSINAALLYPLFLNIANEEQAKYMAILLEQELLKDGGVLTTNIESGEQWDAPNAWAPLQWICYKAMKNYKYEELASKIKKNWCENVENIYKKTGKMMEKYNALQISTIAGGGEYPNQDGFGWTNGVYIKLTNDL